MLDAALSYASRGLHVLPVQGVVLRQGRYFCTCGKEACEGAGKHPLTEHGVRDETTDAATIQAWWERWPRANVGIATGGASGLVVIDVDPRNGGNESLAALLSEHGDLPPTVEAATGGGGRHLLFAQPPGPMTGRVALRPGVDVKSDGGYIVAPPSRHASGEEYRWKNAPAEIAMAPLPAWLAALIRDRRGRTGTGHGRQAPTWRVSPYGLAALEREAEQVASAAEGARHAVLIRAAFSLGQLVGSNHLDDRAVLSELAAAAERAGLPISEAERTIRDGLAAGKGAPRDRPPRRPADDSAIEHEEAGFAALTDSGNAERFAHLHRSVARLVGTWNRWLVWDDVRWAEDFRCKVLALAKATVRSIGQEGAQGDRDDVRRAVLRWARASESRGRREAMLFLARGEEGVAIDHRQLDMHPMLLNVVNGTLDLVTGRLREHRPEDLLTKRIGVPYDPAARCPTWIAFLNRVTGESAELVGFLQRAVGYTLTGSVAEQCLFFLHGTGANGKTTFTNALLDLLGDYGVQGAPNLLLVKRNEAHPTEQADLFGARLVVCQEGEAGSAWAEATVKQLTGGDRIRARRMHENFWEFAPSHKFWVATNHKPRVQGTDHAIWRRIRLVPFNVLIPPAARDRDLPDKLRAELPGILAWAVEGCRAWQAAGLGVPGQVTAATEEYRAEMDVLADFLGDCCILRPTLRAVARELTSAYRQWCDTNGERPMSSRLFSTLLRERDLRPGKSGSTRFWNGIGLAASAANRGGASQGQEGHEGHDGTAVGVFCRGAEEADGRQDPASRPVPDVPPVPDEFDGGRWP